MNGMDFNSAIDIIIKDLGEIGEIADDFRRYPGVPELQVEIIRSKCRYAAEIIGKLKKFEADDTAGAISAEQPESQPDNTVAPDLVTLDERTEEKVTAEDSKPPARSKNDDISSVIKSIPLADIGSAIRMNERFLFIKEIFGGSSPAFEEALGKLNRAESLADAKAIIMSYTGESKETDAVKHLLDIVKRKFPDNG